MVHAKVVASSWATTRRENDPLFQLSEPGIAPSPAQPPHDDVNGKA